MSAGGAQKLTPIVKYSHPLALEAYNLNDYILEVKIETSNETMNKKLTSL